MQPYRPPSPAARTARLLLTYVALFGGAMVLLWLGSRVLHHPRGTAPTVPMPSRLAVGAAPGPLDSGGYRVTLEGARWVLHSSLPPGLRLSYRARPNGLVDYLVVSLSVANRAATPLAMSYLGSGQDVRLLLASTDPESYYTVPLVPSEAALISGQAPLASAALPAGAVRSGVVVYALQRFRKGFELLLLPAETVGQEPAHPAIEMRFRVGG